MKQIALKARQVALIVSVIALGACTAVWGRSFERVGAAPDYVKYKYYLSTVDEGGMNKEAREYCAVYQKNAVLDDRETIAGGATDEYINTYQCVEPNTYVPVLDPNEVR